MTDTTNKQAIGPTAQSLRVLCEKCGKPLCGLFVVVAPAPAQGKAKEILDAGAGQDATADPTPTKPSLALGMTNAEGYVEPVFDKNPWHHYFLKGAPHNLACLSRQPIWLLRHPNADLARAFVRWLDTAEAQEGYDFASWGEPAELAFQGSPTFDDQRQCVLRVPEEAKHFLPRGPDLYDGWSLYRDMPHASCPPVVAQVGRLQRHLGTLRYPIGSKLSPYWPEPRKKPGDIQRNEGDLDGRTQAALGRFQQHAAAGTADEVLDWAAAHGRHVQKPETAAGNANEVPDGAVPNGPGAKKDLPFAPQDTGGTTAGAWSYLLAATDQPKLSGDATLPTYTLGCVDAATGRAIAAWLDRGYRKPGPLLLDVRLGLGKIWLREEAAVAIEAWLALVDAFGVVYASGLTSGIAFRNVLDKGSGNGKRLNSIHKTGLAIDMKSDGFSAMSREWPVRIEGEWIKDYPALRTAQNQLMDLEKKERKAQRAYDQAPATAADAPKRRRVKLKKDLKPALDAAIAKAEAKRQKVDQLEAVVARDAAGSKNKFRLRFRIYAHSKRGMFGSPPDVEAELVDLRAKLAQCSSVLASRLVRKFGHGQGIAWNEAAAKWIATASQTIERASRAVLALDDEEIVERFFRDTLRPWIYEAGALDGGAQGPSLAPRESLPPRYPAPPQLSAVQSYVNATALGGLCGMARINATRSGCWKDPSGMRGKQVILKVRVSKGLGPIVRALEYMKSPHSVHRTDTVPLTRGRTEIELTQDQIDLEALRAWSRLLSDIHAVKNNRVVSRVDMPQLTIALAITPSRKRPLEKILELLEGAKCRVLVLSAGDATQMESAVQTIVTCAQVATTLRQALTQIEEQAKQEKVDRDAWLKEARTARKQHRKPAIPRPVPSKPRARAQLGVTLQPVFLVDASPERVLFYPEAVLELPGLGKPGGLEWWHFQHEYAAGRLWGDLLKDIGFSQDVLQAPLIPEKDSPFWGRGVGYDETNFTDKSGGVRVGKAQIEDNFNEYVPVDWRLRAGAP